MTDGSENISMIRLGAIKSMLAFSLPLLLFSCSNELDEIKKVTVTENFPDETATNLRMVSTDSGMVQFYIEATLMETVHDPDEITYLKDGLKVVFFDEKGKKEAILTAYYGERNGRTGRMFVKDSVVLQNLVEKQKLETEELYWTSDSVYSNKTVVVTTSDMVLFGKGIVTDNTFSVFKIKDPTGKKEIKNE